MAKILCVDDDKSYLKLIKIFLEREGFEVITENNPHDAEESLCINNPDLAVLDVMMPGMNGFELCRAIRETHDIPIIMLTALNDDINEVRGMGTGADDYIAKPFSHAVFVARIKALLRRHQTAKGTTALDAGLLIDEGNGMLVAGDERMHATPREISLIKYLTANKNLVLTRDQLLNNVWGWDYYGDPRTLDTHIKSLRSKSPLLKERIKTVRGTGYCYRGEDE